MPPGFVNCLRKASFASTGRDALTAPLIDDELGPRSLVVTAFLLPPPQAATNAAHRKAFLFMARHITQPAPSSASTVADIAATEHHATGCDSRQVGPLIVAA